MITKEMLKRLDTSRVGPFNCREINGTMLITNDAGRFCLLKEPEFQNFIHGQVDEGTPLHAKLKETGFLREWLDFDKLPEVWGGRNYFLNQGPGLHIVVVTLRCNHRCVYCQASSASMSDPSTDMSVKTARRVVERIFQSPSPAITIEFQGGEPLANWPVVKFIIQEALRRNQKAKKKLLLGLVSNMSLMDEKKLAFLLKNKVTFCTSLDGPADLHDRNRIFLGGESHKKTVYWWKRIFKKTAHKRYRIDALMTVTRASLSRPRELVDEYLRLGARGIYLRFLSRLGLAQRAWQKIGYEPEEFLAFYRKALDYIIERNLRKKSLRFFEQTAKIFLHKILANEEPNNLDIRSPCGAGIGQIAYNYDGAVYTCDEGRMLGRMGNEAFKIGHVSREDLAATIRHPAVKTLVTASSLEAQPICSHCAYKPYCGVCPIANYVEQGDVFGKMLYNSRCKIHMGVQDYLFERLKDDKVRAVFNRWIAKSGGAEISQRY